MVQKSRQAMIAAFVFVLLYFFVEIAMGFAPCLIWGTIHVAVSCFANIEGLKLKVAW